MNNPAWIAVGAFGLALLATLTLAAFCTPAHWWRRPTARNALILVGGTWALGSVLLHLAPAAHGVARAHQQAASNKVDAIGGRRFRAHDDLNLRVGTSVNAARIAIVPAGTLLTASGLREGDWWQVGTQVGGRPLMGWVSSLWLRRATSDEPMAETATAPDDPAS